MTAASPAFQPDRPGTPGFQRAHDLGYQTQTPAAVGDLDIRVTLDAPSTFAALGPYHAAPADLHIVVEFSTVTRGPRPLTPPSVGRPVRMLPMRWRVETAYEIVVTLDAPSAVRRRRLTLPAPRRWAAPARYGVRVTLDDTTRFRDYVREVVLPDDEALLELVLDDPARFRDYVREVVLPDDDAVLDLVGGAR